METADQIERHLIDGKYGIADIVDLEQLRSIFERFTEVTGFTVGFLDHPDLNILIATGWRDICTKFHRGCPASEAVCLKSNRHLLDQLGEPGKVVIEPCDHGLVDCAIPIIVKGKHIASLATGQLFLQKPDPERFKRQARLYGFDEEAYLKAVEEIPVVTEEELRVVTAFLGEIAIVVSQLGYTNLAVKEEALQLVNEMAERKRAEAELAWKTAFLESQVEASMDGILVVDEKGKRILINQYLLDIWKVPQHIQDEADDAPLLQHVTNLIKDPEQFHAKVMYLYDHPHEISRDEIEFKNGMILDRYSSPVIGKDGIYYGRIWTFRDITERKRAEEELRQSEIWYRTIFENTGTATVVLEEDTTISLANTEFEKLTGYTKEEIEGKKSWTEFIESKDDLERMIVRHKLRRINQSAVPKSYEFRLVDKEGRKKDIHLNTDMIPGTKKSIASLLDMTERKQAEDLYRTLAENSHTGVYIAQDKKILFVNPRIEEYCGYSKNELLGIDIITHIHPEDRGMVLRSADDMLRDKRATPYEYRLIDREGNVRRLLEIVRPIFYQGKPAVLGNTMDITERYRMENRLRQAQKMEAIGTLAGGIAHDFNNILSAILGYTEMALTSNMMDAQQRSYLEQVYKAGERARDLVNQILTFSRQRDQERHPLLLSSVIKEGIKLLRSSLPTTIGINQNISDHAIMVIADPTQIHQVVMNLCTNAAHAMRERGGVLDIQLVHEKIETFGPPHLGNPAPGDYAKLIIRDTGCGIDASIMDRIFDPFFTTKSPGEGTGLGLSVVYGIVKNHGGVIDVASESGQGTTVTVYFPLIEAVEVSQERMPEDIPGGSERILFVDDEEVLAELGSTMLSSLGYHVSTRTSSIEALEAFRAQPRHYDLVITDMTMPKMTGVLLARELLQIRPDIPIILCTGFSEMISDEKAKDIGIRRFIMKPISKKVLAKTIREALAGT